MIAFPVVGMLIGFLMASYQQSDWKAVVSIFSSSALGIAISLLILFLFSRHRPVCSQCKGNMHTESMAAPLAAINSRYEIGVIPEHWLKGSINDNDVFYFEAYDGYVRYAKHVNDDCPTEFRIGRVTQIWAACHDCKRCYLLDPTMFDELLVVDTVEEVEQYVQDTGTRQWRKVSRKQVKST